MIFKSDFERRVYDSIFNRGGVCEYEPFAIPYVRTSKYTPDFVLHNGIIIETKGRFVAADRAKHLLVKKQYPKYDIRFVFLSDRKINKNSKTRYTTWCEQKGYKYSLKYVPRSWFLEKPGDSAAELEKHYGYEFDWT